MREAPAIGAPRALRYPAAFMPTAGILIIGNEILSGKVVDTNSPYLCAELRALGVDVERIVTIPDVSETITAEVKAMSAAYDFVFTSGGIGPTHDDLTMDGDRGGVRGADDLQRVDRRADRSARRARPRTRASSRWRWFPPARRSSTPATCGFRP